MPIPRISGFVPPLWGSSTKTGEKAGLYGAGGSRALVSTQPFEVAGNSPNPTPNLKNW
ncbi:hypothetical protein [Parapedobacter koreensis]|uniref:hypothetical protein n=1 Tax=Parapedobacter koreensis TaxID=332977 RepID=UPI0015A58A85|nr:hypothetical protein [Parapedobacter koreensis]